MKINRFIISAIAVMIILSGCSGKNDPQQSDNTQSGGGYDVSLPEGGNSNGNTTSSGGDTSKTGGETADSTVSPDGNSSGDMSYGGAFTERDLDGGYNTDSAVYITLSGNIAEISGGGAECESSVLKILRGGVYVLSGSFDGQIYVEADSLDKVQLVLNGVSVHCKDNAALYIKEADKVFITLPEGTESTLSDSDFYSVRNGDTKTDSAVFSRADIVINGKGTLNVNGSYKHGITSKDDIKITGGILNVTAVNSGIVGKDSVRIASGSITVKAGSDGIKSDNDTNSAKGYVSIYGGELDVYAGKDCIQAESALSLYGGSYNLSAGEYLFNFSAGKVMISGAEICGVGNYLSGGGIDSSVPTVTVSSLSAMADSDIAVSTSSGEEIISGHTYCGAKLFFAASSGFSSGSEYSIAIGSETVSGIAK